MVAFKHTIQHSPNLQIFAKDENNIESRIWPQIDGMSYTGIGRHINKLINVS